MSNRAAPARASRRPDTRLRRAGWTLVSIGGAIAIWQLACMAGIANSTLLPAPSAVWRAATQLAAEGTLWDDIVASLSRVAVGFGLGSVTGTALGLATGRILLIDRLVSPILGVLRPIPAIALVPLAIVWFGVGDSAKFFVIGYAVTVTVWLNTHVGAQAVPVTYLRAARSLGISERRIFAQVVVPAAAPFIFAGLRLGAAVAFLSLVAAELTGASDGIGYRLQEARQFLATDRMFVGLVLLGVLGASLDWVIARIGQKVIHWEVQR